MFAIDVKSVKPIYEQIIDIIKEQTIRGILKEGDQLPSVRQLATILTVNPNTVSKAYQELEREKIIQSIRGKGTFIGEIRKPALDKEKLGQLRLQLKKLCIEMRYMGLSEEAIINEAVGILNDIKGEE